MKKFFMLEFEYLIVKFDGYRNERKWTLLKRDKGEYDVNTIRIGDYSFWSMIWKLFNMWRNNDIVN